MVNSTEVTQEHRIQSAMVLYELEQALGRYVLSNERDPDRLPSKLVQNISEREGLKGQRLDLSRVDTIVEATYLDEVFAFAIHAAGESSERDLLSELKLFCTSLGMYSIRNAISHPNRPFPENFWYRTATIATDSLVQKLKLHSVMKAFRAAETKKLTPPPESWILEARWSVPNNLPDVFEHSITGLIGRKKEIRETHKALENPRVPLIALVGPGGLGKTALLLEVLEKVSLEPASSQWVDEIIYISFKNEILTAEGIQQLPVSPTMSSSELQETVAKEISKIHNSSEPLSYDSLMSQLGDNRALLCLDNLETLLRESADVFMDFYLSLPSNWRVIVTSRITVDMAMTISLKPLDNQGALALAQAYLSRRGGKLGEDKVLNTVVEVCDRNPLAIRLTLDGYLAGTELTVALSNTREEVLIFSFTNLIETLSENSVSVIECLFALGEPASRAELCMLLDLTRDDVAESFVELIKTSLVSRKSSENEERFELSSSIRDLLLLNPIDKKLRMSVVGKVNRRKAQAMSQQVEQRLREITPLDWDYIPDEAPDHAKQLAIRVFSAIRGGGGEAAKEFLGEVKIAAEAVSNDPLIERVCGRLYIILGDHVRGQQHLYKAATKLKPRDPAATLDLAGQLLKSQDLIEANELAEWLIKNNWDDPERSNIERVREIYRIYWLSLMWLGKRERVVEETSGWLTAGELTISYGTFHAAALRRLSQNRDFAQAEDYLRKSLDTLNTLIGLEGIAGVVAIEGMKLIRDIVKRAKHHGELVSPELAFEATSFVDTHLVAMATIHKNYSPGSPELLDWERVLAILDCGENENPLSQKVSLKEVGDTPSEDRLRDEGYEIVNVYGKPEKKLYLFAKGEDNEEFFIHRDNLLDGHNNWPVINVGDRLAVIRRTILDVDKATPVYEARMIY